MRVMPRCFPENPTFTTTSEEEVWRLLREHLGPDDVLIANQRLTTASATTRSTCSWCCPASVR